MAVLGALFDKRKRAVARAKFDAWWNGEDYDAAAVEAALSGAAAAPAPELFEEPDESAPRLLALMRLWGEGRLMPGEDAGDQALHARLGLRAEDALHVMGPGLAGPLVALSSVHPGEIIALEWREETREALMRGVRRAKLEARVAMQALDLDTYSPAEGSIAGLISLDEFTYAANAPRLAHQLARALRPGACAVICTYTAVPSPEVTPAFASSFAEPQLRPAGNLNEVFVEAGLAVEANDDVTEAHLTLARTAFARLEGVLAVAVEQGLDVRLLQEIAWEATAWKARLRTLRRREIERREFVVRKPAQSD